MKKLIPILCAAFLVSGCSFLKKTVAVAGQSVQLLGPSTAEAVLGTVGSIVSTNFQRGNLSAQASILGADAAQLLPVLWNDVTTVNGLISKSTNAAPVAIVRPLGPTLYVSAFNRL